VTEDVGNKTFVVVGATGRVGRVVASTLQRLGHQVRPVARSVGLSFERKTSSMKPFRARTAPI